MTLSGSYAIAAVMLAVAIGLAALALAIGRWMAPPARPAADNSAYEYGGRTGHKTWVQCRVRYAHEQQQGGAELTGARWPH